MSFWDDFRKFAMRGNVIDLAIGFTVGAAFSTIARSLVDDIIMPPISLLTGRVSFADRFLILQLPPGVTEATYTTLEEAEAAGATTLNWGLFVNNILTFLIIALAMYLIIRAVTRVDRLLDEEVESGATQPIAPATEKKCPYCYSTIDRKATRCPYCTSDLTAATEAVIAGPAQSAATPP